MLAAAAAAPDYFIWATQARLGKSLVIKALRFLAAIFTLALATSAAAQNSVDEAERGIVRVVVILQTSEGRMLYGSDPASWWREPCGDQCTRGRAGAAGRGIRRRRVPPQGDGLLLATIIRYSLRRSWRCWSSAADWRWRRDDHGGAAYRRRRGGAGLS